MVHKCGKNFSYSISYLQNPEITELLYLRVESVVGDKDFRVDGEDVGVAAPDPGHRLIVEITEGEIRQRTSFGEKEKRQTSPNGTLYHCIS